MKKERQTGFIVLTCQYRNQTPATQRKTSLDTGRQPNLGKPIAPLRPPKGRGACTICSLWLAPLTDFRIRKDELDS